MTYFTELKPGQKIRIIKSFRDFDNTEITEGTILTFLAYDYFPYDGGYTLKFQESEIRLAEISKQDHYILEHPWEYIQLV